jgi:hypothetical protein
MSITTTFPMEPNALKAISDTVQENVEHLTPGELETVSLSFEIGIDIQFTLSWCSGIDVSDKSEHRWVRHDFECIEVINRRDAYVVQEILEQTEYERTTDELLQ